MVHTDLMLIPLPQLAQYWDSVLVAPCLGPLFCIWRRFREAITSALTLHRGTFAPWLLLCSTILPGFIVLSPFRSLLLLMAALCRLPGCSPCP